MLTYLQLLQHKAVRSLRPWRVYANLSPPLGPLDEPSLSPPGSSLVNLSDLDLGPSSAEERWVGKPADAECVVDRRTVEEAKDLEVGLGLVQKEGRKWRSVCGWRSVKEPIERERKDVRRRS